MTNIEPVLHLCDSECGDQSHPRDGWYQLESEVAVHLEPYVTLDNQSGTIYTPWTDGTQLGFRCEHPDGRVAYIYLNPSTDGAGMPDHRPNVFVYVSHDFPGRDAEPIAVRHFEVD